MPRTGQDGTTTHELGNLRFLIAQQLSDLDDIERHGRDGRAARELLGRLLRRHEQLRRADGAGEQRVA